MAGGMTKLRGNPWAVLVVVSLGFFMTLLDLTIVNIGPDRVAVPREEPGQMAGTISSPGSSGQNPGSSSGTGS